MSIVPHGHINASNTRLTGQRRSPFMPESAAESAIQYKDGNWLFSYQQKDLEVHVLTLLNADRNTVWIGVSIPARSVTSAITQVGLNP